MGADDVSISGGSLAFSDKTAADGKTVTASGCGLSGAKAADYTLGAVTVNHADITKASLTVTNTAVNDKIYDSTASAAFASTPALSGKVSGDDVSLTPGTPSFAGKDYAASPIAVNFTAFSISGTDAGNYTLTQPAPVTASITKKALAVSVNPVSIMCGQAIPTLTVNVSGFVSGENVGNVTGFVVPKASQSYGATTSPVTGASLAITYSDGNATNNYAFSYQNSTTLTIQSVADNTVNILPSDIEDNAPSVKLQGPSSDIGQAALTDSDEQSLASGSDISIYLRVKKIDVVQADQAVVSSALNGQTLGQYLDVSLIKNIDGAESNITQTSIPLRLTFGIPADLTASGRTFSIIRVHDGVAAMLSDLDNDPTTITIETDRFSTYAIVYTNSAANTNPVENPKTGDQTSMIPLAIQGFGSLIIAIIVRKRRYRLVKKK